MRFEAVEKAERMVEDDPLLKYQPADIKEAAIRQKVNLMINAAQDKPNAGGDIAAQAAAILASREPRRTLTGGR
jgi:hypothetical protein